MYCVLSCFFFFFFFFFWGGVHLVVAHWLSVLLWAVKKYLIQLSERLQLIFCTEPSAKTGTTQQDTSITSITKTILSYAYMKLMKS
jgi:hypothetical protein